MKPFRNWGRTCFFGSLLGSLGLAYYKAQEATRTSLPTSGAVLLSVPDQDKLAVLEIAREFARLDYKIKATAGTCSYLKKHGVAAEEIKKLYEGRPNIVDGVTNNEINLVINTPSGKRSQYDDSYIRKTAIRNNVPYITTLAAALASARGIAAYKENNFREVKSLQEYHADITG